MADANAASDLLTGTPFCCLPESKLEGVEKWKEGGVGRENGDAFNSVCLFSVTIAICISFSIINSPSIKAFNHRR